MMKIRKDIHTISGVIPFLFKKISRKRGEYLYEVGMSSEFLSLDVKQTGRCPRCRPTIPETETVQVPGVSWNE